MNALHHATHVLPIHLCRSSPNISAWRAATDLTFPLKPSSLLRFPMQEAGLAHSPLFLSVAYMLARCHSLCTSRNTPSFCHSCSRYTPSFAYHLKESRILSNSGLIMITFV